MIYKKVLVSLSIFVFTIFTPFVSVYAEILLDNIINTGSPFHYAVFKDTVRIGDRYGAIQSGDDLIGNITVSVTNGENIKGHVVGVVGFNTYNNTVNIGSGQITIAGNIFGVYNENDIFGNKEINITGTKLNINDVNLSHLDGQLISGVRYESYGTISDNHVNINKLISEKNSITISGVYGDNKLSGLNKIIGNSLTIKDSTLSRSTIYGVFSSTSPYGEGIVMNQNKLVLSGTTINRLYGFKALGGKDKFNRDAPARYVEFIGNEVLLDKATIKDKAFITTGLTNSRNNVIKILNSELTSNVSAFHLRNDSDEGDSYAYSINDRLIIESSKFTGSSLIGVDILYGTTNVEDFYFKVKDAEFISKGQSSGGLKGISSESDTAEALGGHIVRSKMSISGNTNIQDGLVFIGVGLDSISVESNELYVGYDIENNTLGNVTIGSYIAGVTINGANEGNINNNRFFIGGESVSSKDVYGIFDVQRDRPQRPSTIITNISNNQLFLGYNPKDQSNTNVIVNGNAYAVYSKSLGTISHNSLYLLSGASISGDIYGVYSSNNTNISNNSVNIGVTNNKLVKDNINLSNIIYGSYGSGVSTFDNNKVNVDALKSQVTLQNNIYAAYGTNAESSFSGNTINFLGSVTNDKDVYGAYSESYTNILNNQVIADSKNGRLTINGNLYGAFANGGDISDKVIKNNQVLISGTSNINSSLYGAYSNIGGRLENNMTAVNGQSVINKDIFGAYSLVSADLIANYLVLGSETASNIQGQNMYAAYSETNGKLDGNILYIAEKTNVDTGTHNISAAYTKTGTANMTNNKIIVGTPELKPKFFKNDENVSTKSAYSVEVISGGVYGAYSDAENGVLSGNEVIVAADTHVQSQAAGAYHTGSSGSLSNNSVYIINNADITGSLYGAYAKGKENTTTLNNNLVVVGALPNDKGIIDIVGNIYGAYTEGKGDAQNNTVKLIGHNNLSKADIYGSFSANGGSQTGNTLLLDKFRGEIKSINNFSNITFGNTPDNVNVWIRKSSIVNITGGQATDLSGVKFTNIPDLVADNDVILREGDRMNLIRNDNGLLNAGSAYNHNARGRLRLGFTEQVIYHLKHEGTSIQIILGEDKGEPVLPPDEEPVIQVDPERPQTNPIPPQQDEPDINAKPILEREIAPESESFLGGRDALSDMVKRSGDMIAEINSRIIHPLEEQVNSKKYAIGTFIKTGGGYIEDKGKSSNITISRAALLTGIGANFKQNIADIFLTTFFEGGFGKYNRVGTYSVIEQGNNTNVDIYSDGVVDYYGGGLTLRSDFKVKPAHIVYIDSSFRGGETNYSYKAKNYVNQDNVNAEYKSSSIYYGAHFGTGYMYNLDDKYIFDVYTRYLFNYYNDDEVLLPDNEKIHFDSFSSHRLHTGLRVNFKTPVGITPFIGAGFEYQADENITAHVKTKKIQGHESTLDIMGTFEAGFTYGKQFEKLTLNLDIKGKGSVGALNSGAGSFDIRLNF